MSPLTKKATKEIRLQLEEAFGNLEALQDAAYEQERLIIGKMLDTAKVHLESAIERIQQTEEQLP